MAVSERTVPGFAGLFQARSRTAVAAATAVVVVFALMLLTSILQRSLMYQPATERIAPASVGLSQAREEILTTVDGERLVAWFIPAQPGQRTIVYFHGNGGGLAQRADRMGRYAKAGFGMFMMSYRGYSGSTGLPSEPANISDALAAYDHVRAKGVAATDVVLYGESLGTGVATQVAAQRTSAGLVLDAPYTSIVDIASRRYPFLPVGWVITDRYETIDVIGRVTTPVLIVHGERDRIVPVTMGRAVFAAVTAPKKLITYPEAGHSDHWRYGSTEAVIAWLEGLSR
jgi:fermentation-respiration switch protein FrsA (DUF1100 family)